MPPSKRSRERLIQRREFLQKGALAGAAIVGSAAGLPGEAVQAEAAAAAQAQAQGPGAAAGGPPTTPIMTAASPARNRAHISRRWRTTSRTRWV